MSNMKMLLDVVHDMRTLAASLEALAHDIASGEPEMTTSESSPSPSIPMAHTESAKAVPTIIELRAFVAERSTPETAQKSRRSLLPTE